MVDENFKAIAGFYNGYQVIDFEGDLVEQKEVITNQMHDLVAVLKCLSNISKTEGMKDVLVADILISLVTEFDLVEKDKFISVQENLKEMRNNIDKINSDVFENNKWKAATTSDMAVKVINCLIP